MFEIFKYCFDVMIFYLLNHVALPDPEPLDHFPCIDELRIDETVFFYDGGFLIDVENRLASVSKIMDQLEDLKQFHCLPLNFRI